jgi:hypothetical protein
MAHAAVTPEDVILAIADYVVTNIKERAEEEERAKKDSSHGMHVYYGGFASDWGQPADPAPVLKAPAKLEYAKNLLNVLIKLETIKSINEFIAAQNQGAGEGGHHTVTPGQHELYPERSYK